MSREMKIRETKIVVPYEDFLAGEHAKVDLDNIRNIVINDIGYCSDSIKAILRIPIRNVRGDINAGAD